MCSWRGERASPSGGREAGSRLSRSQTNEAAKIRHRENFLSTTTSDNNASAVFLQSRPVALRDDAVCVQSRMRREVVYLDVPQIRGGLDLGDRVAGPQEAEQVREVGEQIREFCRQVVGELLP